MKYRVGLEEVRKRANKGLLTICPNPRNEILVVVLLLTCGSILPCSVTYQCEVATADVTRMPRMATRTATRPKMPPRTPPGPSRALGHLSSAICRWLALVALWHKTHDTSSSSLSLDWLYQHVNQFTSFPLFYKRSIRWPDCLIAICQCFRCDDCCVRRQGSYCFII